MARSDSPGNVARVRGSIAVAVDVVLFTLRSGVLQGMLIKRRNPPFQGMWALPGGFVEPQESLEEAALRELYEEAGIDEPYIEQLYAFGQPDRDPRMRVISIAYLALTAPVQAKAGDDAVEADWYPLDDLPPMAFDHAKIVDCALMWLRHQLQDETVGFHLLPTEFTLTELQTLYEAVYGEKLDKRNFRRRILQASILQITGSLRVGEGRPARLYRYRKDVEITSRRLLQ